MPRRVSSSSPIDIRVGLGFGVDYTRDNTWTPVVMQWNFWLSEHRSVFGEPGFAFRFADHGHANRADFTIYGGGRRGSVTAWR